MSRTLSLPVRPEAHIRGAVSLPLVAVVLAGAALALVLLAHGFLPGLLGDSATAYLSQGSIRCLNELGVHALTSWCHEFGEPLGYPILTGGPVFALGAVFMYLPGVDSYGAYLLAGAAFDALALAGGYGLMRRLGAPRLVALGAATVYLVTPTIVGLRMFPGTFTGFALLPAYAWSDLTAMDVVQRRRGRTLALALAGYAALRTGALFMDGYSFVASALVGGCLWLGWLSRAGTPTRRKILGIAAFAGASAFAVAVYARYVPADYEQNPIGIFRSMGLDVFTTVAPTEWVWSAGKLQYASDHRELWGDGTNSAYNYVGIFCLALAVAYFLKGPRRSEAVAIAAAGVIALVLSFGPSLKIGDTKPEVTSQPTFESYLMPEGVAAADLPWDGLFTALPGVDSMRATYRWFGVTRLALVVLAALAITRLGSTPGRRRWAAIALAGVAAVELMPNLPLATRTYEAQHDQAAKLQADVETDLQRETRHGERAFFLSYDGSHNDYLANYLSAGAGLRTFNAGGDKNVLMSQRTWPPEIVALAAAETNPDSIAHALEQGLTDVVIAPFFHLRWSAYSWPPPIEMRAQAEAALAPTLSDPRLRVERHPWFATIRLRRSQGQ